jgi:proton glutamate symport protein
MKGCGQLGGLMNRLANIPLGVRVLAALLLGVCAGILLPRPGAQEWSDLIVSAAHIAGQLWLSALQMTVIPLIFSLLTIGLTASSRMIGDGGSVARRALLVFAVLYVCCLTAAVALNRLLIDVWPVSQGAADAFQKFAGNAVQVKAPGAGEIILSIMPSNIFGALAAGSILPVVVFAILFGLAMRHLEKNRREQLRTFIESIADVMFKIVSWVLLMAPIGVFGLVLGTAHETGLAIVWGLAGYLRHVTTIALAMMALAYPVAALWGRVGLMRFAAAATPSQLVAVSTQSSVASLPVMLKSSERLGVVDEVTNVTLPLAVSIFRFGGPSGTISVAFYAAAAAGLHPAFPALIGGALLALLMEFAAVGLPNQINGFTINAPVFAALGAPFAFLPIMLAVETIPDAVGTTANVSMDLAATAVVDRFQRRAISGRRGRAK